MFCIHQIRYVVMKLWVTMKFAVKYPPSPWFFILIVGDILGRVDGRDVFCTRCAFFLELDLFCHAYCCKLTKNILWKRMTVCLSVCSLDRFGSLSREVWYRTFGSLPQKMPNEHVLVFLLTSGYFKSVYPYFQFIFKKRDGFRSGP